MFTETFVFSASHVGCALYLGILNTFVATCRPGPEFSGTFGELEDVLVESVFPSESGVTFLFYPPPTSLQGIHVDLDAIPSKL